MTVVILPRRRRFCISCGIEFRPIAAHHTRCGRCFAWWRIALHVAATRRALEAT